MTQASDLVERHVEDFNHGVRSGDFAPMLRRFADDAELVFEGVPSGPYVGKEAIVAAYRDQPPDDRIAVESVRHEGDTLVCDYRWASEPDRVAGEMRFDIDGEVIRRLMVTFSG
jgi:hypothetical protein